MSETQKRNSLRWLYLSPLSYLTLLGFVQFFLLWPLQNNPAWLYPLLPESLYDKWEEFATLRMEHVLDYLTMALQVVCLAFGLYTLCFSRLRLLRKIGIGLAYLLLAFLLFLSIPADHPRERARRLSCTSNLKQIFLALTQYTGDYEGFLPPNLSLLASEGYLPDRQCYRCPSRTRPNQEFSDYLYFGAGRKLEDAPFLLLQDRNKNHLGIYWNNLYSDGQCREQKK